MSSVTSNPSEPQPSRLYIYNLLLRLVRSQERFERLLDEGIGAHLNGRYPFGDGRTDRWGRGRRR